MKIITLFLMVAIFGVMTQVIDGFPRKQWKQLTGTMRIHEEMRLMNLGSYDEDGYLLYGFFTLTEYGDTLRAWYNKEELNDPETNDRLNRIFRYQCTGEWQ